MRVLPIIEKLLLSLGMLMIGVYLSASAHGLLWANLEIARFEALQHIETETANETDRASSNAPDLALWSSARIDAYKKSLTRGWDPPLAIVVIPKIHLEVPLLEGTDELTLNHAVGHIAGTTIPGGDGNTGIAGHRDGFFRGLKDVVVGDEIILRLSAKTKTYRIDKIAIVAPSDVTVLGLGDHPALTLVTCYPFYFVGSAPQRYIVHASLSYDVKAQK